MLPQASVTVAGEMGELGYEDAPLSLSPRQLPVVLNGDERPAGLLPEDQRGEHPRYDRVRPVTATASVILADNPSEMTLEGTNTWLLRGPEAESIVALAERTADEIVRYAQSRATSVRDNLRAMLQEQLRLLDSQ